MRILAIETSGRLGSVALLEIEGDRTIVAAERRTPDGERTARSLLPTIQELLREHQWRPADVNLVCVTTGPGSFTGLRIGVVVAKTFAYATGANLVGVHTFAAMLARIETDAPRLWTILDAQREELFAMSFTRAESLTSRSCPGTNIVGVKNWLRGVMPGDIIAGPPLEKLRPQLPSWASTVDEQYWHPMASGCGIVGVQLHRRVRGDDPLGLVPKYFRKSAAEEKVSRDAVAERGD